MSPRPQFGAYLRGARLGFHWSEDYQALIRISGEDNRWLMEVCPGVTSKIPGKSRGTFRVWWDGPDHGKTVLDLCPQLAQHRGTEEYVAFLTDDDGNVIDPAAPPAEQPPIEPLPEGVELEAPRVSLKMCECGHPRIRHVISGDRSICQLCSCPEYIYQPRKDRPL